MLSEQLEKRFDLVGFQVDDELVLERLAVAELREVGVEPRGRSHCQGEEVDAGVGPAPYPVNNLFRFIKVRDHERLEAELGGLADALLAALHRADFPCQPDFTKHKRFVRQRLVFQRRIDTASSTAKSAAGSWMRTPPTALTKTS